MSTSVLIVSCDSYDYCWKPFFTLYKKYWKHPYKTYICTETKDCEYATTIKTTGSWTSRLRQALEQIDTDYVIILLEDFFFHKEVDQKRIEEIKFDKDTAVYNFELDYNNLGEDFRLRQNQEPYLNSCQPSIHDRLKLIERLQEDKTPWEWEFTKVDSPYKFYINTKDLVFDIGYYKNKAPWGIVQGKISDDMKELFKREKLELPNIPKLSIIIPYYKTLNETNNLMSILIPQLNDKVEVLLVDDGCNEQELDKLPINIYHKKNGGVSSARNYALNKAKGEYVAFIDSDDSISCNYVSKILEKIEENYDYFYISWQCFGKKDDKVIIIDEPPTWNTCVWNCVYKKSLIGNVRFNENIQYGEEIDFNYKVRRGNRGNITDVLYLYNVGREESATEMYSQGKLTKEKPLKAQLVVYLKFISKIGGVEDSLYELFKENRNKHDILFLYEDADPDQLRRYKKLVKCRLYRNEKIECETYLNANCPKNIADRVTATSGNYYDMYHTDYDAMQWQCPLHPKTTLAICVSEVVKKAFLRQHPNTPCVVIPNLLNLDEVKKVDNPFTTNGLKLISATRLSWEKGYSRMKTFAKRLNELNIDFEWLVFTNDVPDENIPNFKFMKPCYNVTDYVALADYYCVLSNTEADSMSNKKALYLGIPIITTNYPSIYEQGFVDGKTGYVLEMDMYNMGNIINKMKSIPKYEPIRPNHAIKWLPYLGEETKSDYEYDPNEPLECIEDKWVVTTDFVRDDTDTIVKRGEIANLYSSERIRVLLDHDMIKRKEAI